MSDYGCLKEHLPKTLGQTILQSMVWVFLKIATVAKCLLEPKLRGNKRTYILGNFTYELTCEIFHLLKVVEVYMNSKRN